MQASLACLHVWALLKHSASPAYGRLLAASFLDLLTEIMPGSGLCQGHAWTGPVEAAHHKSTSLVEGERRKEPRANLAATASRRCSWDAWISRATACACACTWCGCLCSADHPVHWQLQWCNFIEGDEAAHNHTTLCTLSCPQDQGELVISRGQAGAHLREAPQTGHEGLV